MKNVTAYLLTLLIGFSAFAQTTSEQKIEEVRSAIAAGISEDAADFFAVSQNDFPEFIDAVGHLKYIQTRVAQSVIKTMYENDHVEESFQAYLKKNPNVTINEFEVILVNQVAVLLKNYSPNVVNSFLTFIELYERHNTENEQFISQRSYSFLEKIRKILILPELNRSICIKVNGAEYCPAAKPDAPKPYRQPSPVRLEKR